MGQKQINRVHMIGNTHFDPVWLWSWDEGLSSIRSTFRSALDRMKENDEFIYSFSCPPVFEWIRQVDKDLFTEIQERVAEGRWCLSEGLWLQPDLNTATGESYVRQCLHGQRYLKKYFNRYSDTAFNIDSFGHSLMLPQIFQKSNIKYYVIGRPDMKDLSISDPLFLWESPDKSQVTVYRAGVIAGAFSADIAGQIDKALAQIDGFKHDLMIVYGVTNHGGAPTKRLLAEINRKKKESHHQVIYSDTSKFFQSQNISSLQVLRDEIPIRFFGVFSNHNDTKKNNRIAERCVLNAEKAALLNRMINGRPYPSETLTACCQDILFNQFHDILGGACIEDAYTDASNLYGRSMQNANEIMHYSLQAITRRINCQISRTADNAWNLVVWNLNPFEVDEPIEAEVQWAWEFDWYKGDICLSDDQGIEIECQLIQTRSTISGFRSRFVFKACIPSLGYKVFHVLQKSARDHMKGAALTASESVLESQWLRVELCAQTGSIQKIIDKKDNRVIAGQCALPIVLEDTSDTWAFNFKEYGVQENFAMQSAKVLECGEIRAKVRTIAVCGRSTIEQDFTIYRDSSIVDGYYRVHWHEQQKTLKFSFDPCVKEPQLKAAAPYCSVSRPFDEKEMPVGEWLAVYGKENGNGMAILWDSIFAYNTKEGRIQATVLRSPIYGDLRTKELDSSKVYDYMSQGVSEGKWRMIRSLRKDEAYLWRASSAFNNVPVIVIESNHGGDLSDTNRFWSQDGCERIWLTALKQAEEGDDIIMRLQNVTDTPQQVSVQFLSIVVPDIVLQPYEIKTMSWNPSGRMREVNLLEE